MFFYSGFDNHLIFTNSSYANKFVRPLNDLILGSNNLSPDDCIAKVFLGWCALYVVTKNGKLIIITYKNPLNSEANISSIEHSLSGIVDIQGESKKLYILSTDGNLFVTSNKDLPTIHPEYVNLKHSNVAVQQMSIGTRFSCLLLSNGHAKVIDNDEGSLEIWGSDDEIKSVCCGHEHVIMLTNNGQVLSYGKNSRGQLGQNSLENELDEAKLVEALDGIQIKEIAAGGWHSIAVSNHGDMYSWGWNEMGQLGFPRESAVVKAVPTLVETTDSINFISVSCGSRHSMAISDVGDVYAFGWNKWCQLGVDSSVHQQIDCPSKVQLTGKAKSITCGYWSSLIEIE